MITSRGDTGNLCEQGDLESSYLYNEGRGIFLKDGNARIEFCSDGSGMVRNCIVVSMSTLQLAHYFMYKCKNH